MRILIVEDNPTDRQLLLYLLEDRFSKEAKFREADNLATAFKYLDMGNFDCVILDLQLPDSVGRETFDKLYERYPDIPMVVMTHNKDRELALEMIRAGAADYILKDYTNEDDLFHRIVFAIEKHRRTVRMPPENASTVHQLERMRANIRTAHQSGQHEAVREATVESTDAALKTVRDMFTAVQSLEIKVSEVKTRQEVMAKTVTELENEIFKGAGERPSMRSEVDLLTHRIKLSDKRQSDFKELLESKMEDVRQSIHDGHQGVVQIKRDSMSHRTKVILGILTLLGVVATAIATYQAAVNGRDVNGPVHIQGD